MDNVQVERDGLKITVRVWPWVQDQASLLAVKACDFNNRDIMQPTLVSFNLSFSYRHKAEDVRATLNTCLLMCDVAGYLDKRLVTFEDIQRADLVAIKWQVAYIVGLED